MLLLTIKAYIAHMVDVHPYKYRSSMNLRFQMIDTDTGELLANTYCNYACNFSDKQDTGFRKCLAWCHSAVRGIRCCGHDNLELRIGFGKEKSPEFLNLQIDDIDVY